MYKLHLTMILHKTFNPLQSTDFIVQYSTVDTKKILYTPLLYKVHM